MPEHIARLRIHPVGAASPPVPGRRELPAVAVLAVDVSVLAVVDAVVVQLLGARRAAGALLVVALGTAVAEDQVAAVLTHLAVPEVVRLQTNTHQNIHILRKSETAVV